LQAQGALQRSASKAAFATLQGATAKRKWDQADIDFKRRRTQAARDIADQKVSLAITEGGAFNYAEQVNFARNQYCVRIRGVNMFTRGPAGIWKATLSVPDRSFYSAKDGTEQPVDQHDIALLRLGKVGPRSSERYQEIYGTTSLRNIAPFGNWRVTVDDRSTHSETRDSIQDIEIDFELLVRSQKRVV
jgi:hypothetical protein